MCCHGNCYQICIEQGSPQENLRHSGWAWFGRNLCPHQPFWLPHQRNMDIEGVGGAMLKGPGENTVEFR